MHLFLFDFATPGRGHGQSTFEGAGWQLESEATENPETQTLTRVMTITAGDAQRTETHVLHLYDADKVATLLNDAGFDWEHLHAYAGFDFWPGYAAFAAIAKRRY